MNTVSTFMNSPADTAVSSSDAVATDQRSTALDDSASDKPRGDSPFAAMLQKESAGSKSGAEKADKTAAKTNSDSKSEQAEAAPDAGNAQDENSTVAPTDSEASPSLQLSDSTEQSLDIDPQAPNLLVSATTQQSPVAAGRGMADQALTVNGAATPAAQPGGEAGNAVTSKSGQAETLNLAVPGADAPDSARAQELTAASGEAAKPLVITRIHQGQVFSQSESFAMTGKTLPQGGKNLPTGIFFNSEGSSNTELRFSDSGPAIDLDGHSKGKQSTGFGMEFNADSLMRGLLAGKTAPGVMNTDLTPLTAQPSNAAGSENTVPPLLNPGLQVAGDKPLPGMRGALLPGLEASPQFTITAEAGSNEWGNQLSSRIRWMGNLNLSSAELKLHPAELGTVEIQISTEEDQTRVSFVTSNAAAKEIIESSLPRLKDLLGESGLQLQHGDVAHREREEREEQQTGENAEAGTGVSSDDETLLQESTLHISRKSTSQVDHYV